jgi:endonuclease YncB( thermonuclease family)
MACKDNLMKKIIYLIAILITTSTLQAKEGTLIDIADGDTLFFETNSRIDKCEIAYIDTPENSYNNKLKQDIKICKNISTNVMLNAGDSATKHANKLLKIGNSYNYSTYIKNSEQICEVSLGNGMTFSEKMLLDGYAVIWKVNKKQKEEQNFSSVLTYAKNKNNGLWGDKSERGEVIKCLEKISAHDSKISESSYQSK